MNTFLNRDCSDSEHQANKKAPVCYIYPQIHHMGYYTIDESPHKLRKTKLICMPVD